MGKREAPDVGRTIHRLYECAVLNGPTRYRALATEACATLLPFDGVFWGVASRDSVIPASIWRQRLPGDFLAGLEPPDWDSLDEALFGAPPTEETAISPFSAGRGAITRVSPARAQLQRASIGHGLALRSPHPGRPVHSLILLLRREGKPPFSDAEVEMLHKLVPHLGGAFTLALRGLANVDQLLQSLGRPSRHSAAVLDDRGQLLESDDRFAALLRAHFPEWRGNRLPFALPPLDRVGAEEPVVAGLHVRGSRNEGLTIVHLREVNPMDLLSPRERDVVRAIASGLTLKSIGKRLNISPSTVANHAARIYAKLGIHSRDRLVEMLKLLGPGTREGNGQSSDKAG